MWYLGRQVKEIFAEGRSAQPYQSSKIRRAAIGFSKPGGKLNRGLVLIGVCQFYVVAGNTIYS